MIPSRNADIDAAYIIYDRQGAIIIQRYIVVTFLVLSHTSQSFLSHILYRHTHTHTTTLAHESHTHTHTQTTVAIVATNAIDQAVTV